MTAFEEVVLQCSEVADLATKSEEYSLEKVIGETLNKHLGYQSTRMAMAILVYSTMFHQDLTAFFPVKSIEIIRASSNRLSELLDTWHHIRREINYLTIFDYATQILSCFEYHIGNQLVCLLARGVEQIVDTGITTLYDLPGLMFQRLITDRNDLAKFYTLPSSANLLAELAIGQMEFDWSNAKKYHNLHIADLACGTGTLLAAAYRKILQKYQIYDRDGSDIHREMLEKCIVATDILPAATHLVSCQLAGFNPALRVRRIQVHTMPYGLQPEETGRDISIGSLDLLDQGRLKALFPTRSVDPVIDLRESLRGELEIPDGYLDLIIMNPPITKPTNHKNAEAPVPSFAEFATSDDEQSLMSQKLAQITKGLEQRVGHGNAGLASNFCDLAHLKLKEGGTLALVLPIAAISGKAWENLRTLLESSYTNVKIVTLVNSKSSKRAFSADTDMPECLLIATKTSGNSEKQKPHWHLVNLTARPSTLFESAEYANQILKSTRNERGNLQVGDDRIGTYVSIAPNETYASAIKSSALIGFIKQFLNHEPIQLRGEHIVNFNRIPLRSLGIRGKVHRDVGVINLSAKQHRGAFAVSRTSDNSVLYPVLWWHDSERERKFEILPDSEGEVIAGRERIANEVWHTASRIHICLDFSTASQAIVVCRTPRPSLGGRAWPTIKLHDTKYEKIFVLWGNSTLGLMSLWASGSKQHSGRSILTITKVPELTVFDPSNITAKQLGEANDFYDDFYRTDFLPANQASKDPSRIALDSFVLKNLCNVSDEWFEDFAVIREQWCKEPIVSGRS